MFITFEGIEGSGKSTALHLLADHLEQRGFCVRRTREPGDSALGRVLRHVLLDARNTEISGRAELFLFLADRVQHVKEVILPALEAEELVLCDRYSDSTFVYQGAGRGMDQDRLRQLNEYAVCGTTPALTLLFDVPVEIGLKRAARRNEEDGVAVSEGRFDAESIAFHTRIREAYLQLAAEEPDRIATIDATQTPEDVLLQCISVVEQKLREYGRPA